jgi:hypothetical protein
MTLPCLPIVKIRLGNGVSFGDAFVLGSLTQGELGVDELGGGPGAIDITEQVTRIATRHGRDRMFEEYTPGTAIVEFLDFNGDWNPANSSGPYYGQILPMRQIQVFTVYNSTTYFIFSGYITSWDYTWDDQSVDYARVTVQAIDAFRLLQLANITTVTGAANKDLPGERINLILNEIGWPNTLRDIDDGDTELEGDPGDSRSALAAIQTIEQSDLGAFFIKHDGTATYYSRGRLSQIASGTAYEFSDDGTDIAYQDIDINFDETELANQVTLTRLSGQPQTVSDATSIDNYFLRSYQRSGLMMETNSIALTRAGQILNYRKNPRLRVDSLTLDMSSDSTRVEPGLALEIGQPIIVNKTMAGSTSITLRVTVQGHESDITPETWTTRFTTAYPLSTAFILGSTEFGVLGTNTL